MISNNPIGQTPKKAEPNLCVFICFLFSIRIYNIIICVSKHPDSNHQLLPTASFFPQPTFQKSFSEKSRNKQAQTVSKATHSYKISVILKKKKSYLRVIENTLD